MIKFILDFDIISFITQVCMAKVGDGQSEGGDLSPVNSVFRLQTKNTGKSLPTYVERLVYYKRKNCVKRKLNFDVDVEHPVVKKKTSTSSDCKKSSIVPDCKDV
jgi:hypothetical protein